MRRHDERIHNVTEAAQRATSRRSFLAGSARLAGAGALALGAGGLAAGRGAWVARASVGLGDDLDVLRYLQRVEQLAYALYDDALRRFSVDEHNEDRPIPRYPTLQRIRDQEQSHLVVLTQAITARGGTPEPTAPASDFGYADFAGFLTLAAETENGIVAAYVGATAVITEPALRELVAGVLAVEARHAAYLNQRIGASPFPAATEQASPAVAAILSAG